MTSLCGITLCDDNYLSEILNVVLILTRDVQNAGSNFIQHEPIGFFRMVILLHDRNLVAFQFLCLTLPEEVLDLHSFKTHVCARLNHT